MGIRLCLGLICIFSLGSWTGSLRPLLVIILPLNTTIPVHHSSGTNVRYRAGYLYEVQSLCPVKTNVPPKWLIITRDCNHLDLCALLASFFDNVRSPRPECLKVFLMQLLESEDTCMWTVLSVW